MKTPRKTSTDPRADDSKARGRRQTEGARHSGKKETRTVTHKRRRNSKIPDLPPNENIRKHPDEIYGDTEITDRNEDI